MSKPKSDPNNSEPSDCLLDISKLSYEESLKELDHILNKLQDENFLIEELQENYHKATLYLKHCENLLINIEQEVIKMETNNFSSIENE